MTGTTILPEETKAKMRALYEKNPIMKAKDLRLCSTKKSRYVSIQGDRRMEADGCE
jgi:hypothetical protein